MQRCPYLAEMKERFWRSNNNGNENKKLTDDEGDELLKSVAMTTKSKQSTIARLAQPEPDDPDESLPMLPIHSNIVTSTPAPVHSVPTVVKVSTILKFSFVIFIRRMDGWMLLRKKVLVQFYNPNVGYHHRSLIRNRKETHVGRYVP